MSTKTTFKRIALVAVAALGLGVLTSAPSQAADTTASTFTASLSLAHTSATVVGYDTGNPDRSAAIFQMTAIGNGGQSSHLFATESITASVRAGPTGAATEIDDLLITPVKGNFRAGFSTAVTGATVASTAGLGALISAADNAGVASPDQARTAAGQVPTNPNSVYYFAVTPAADAAVDAGFYTVRIRLQDASGFITNYSVTAKFVRSAADSGAVIVPTSTGRYVQAESTIEYTSTRNMQATLRDANNGRIFLAGAADLNVATPVLSAAFTTSAGVVRNTETLTIADSGTDLVDHVAIVDATTAAGNPVSAANR